MVLLHRNVNSFNCWVINKHLITRKNGLQKQKRKKKKKKWNKLYKKPKPTYIVGFQENETFSREALSLVILIILVRNLDLSGMQAGIIQLFSNSMATKFLNLLLTTAS